MDEIFDGWHKKGANDYGGRFFKEWWKRDVEDWVKRDRNHPCVVLWSIGNETGHSDKHDITGHIHRFDDNTRPTTGGTCFHGVDVSGFNGPAGMPGVIEEFHKKYPDRPVVVTEEPHTLQTRGFYRVPTWWRDRGGPRFDFEPYGRRQIFFDGHPRYKSSYDNASVRMCARTSWKRTRDTPWLSGEFRWTGFDCLGEAQFMGADFPKRCYNSGIIDLAGFPKDTYYFYQSQWTTDPMVHILPHWTHPALEVGTEIPVIAYSNADEVELFLNGRSLGRKPQRKDLLDFVWRVPWQPGELKAIAYRHDRSVAETRVRTAGAPAKLKLAVEGANLPPDRRSMAWLTVSALDRKGVFVPWAHDDVQFKIDGPVRLLGFENGDPTDGTDHRVLHRKLFYGLARGFFQATQEDGGIAVTAAAILGDRLFQKPVSVAISVARATLRGKPEAAAYTIHYTLDGSEPTTASPRYEKPFVLSGSATVRALVLQNGKWVFSLKADFVEGPDPTWKDSRLSVDRDKESISFDGPFDREVAGKWREGKTFFDFRANGEVHARGKQIAHWWYDFPNDLDEVKKSETGTGQMRWVNSGDVSTLTLCAERSKALLVRRKT